MKLFYLTLFFGEVVAYQVEASSEEEAEILARKHLFDTEGVDDSDPEDEEIDVAFYDGEAPWTTKEKTAPGSHLDGSPMKNEDPTDDYTGLAKMAAHLKSDGGGGYIVLREFPTMEEMEEE